MAAEFVSRLTKDFDRPGLPAIALTLSISRRRIWPDYPEWYTKAQWRGAA
jgi:hypothetical protein